MVEGRIDDTIFHFLFFHQIKNLLLDLRIPENSRLQFDIDLHMSRLHKFQNLSERRDFYIGILFKMIGHGKALQFFQRIISDGSFPVADAVDGFIMDDNQFSVLCQLNVQLNSVCPLLHRQTERLQCVFRSVCARSSVCKNFYFFHRFLPPIVFLHCQTYIFTGKSVPETFQLP